MAAIFNAPIAAVLLALEVLLFEWKPRSFMPVVSAMLASWSRRNALIGTGVIFPVPWKSHLQTMQLIVAVGIGALTGVVAVTLSKSLYRLEEWFHQLPVHWMWWPALGSVIVGVGGILQPRLLALRICHYTKPVRGV